MHYTPMAVKLGKEYHSLFTQFISLFELSFYKGA